MNQEIVNYIRASVQEKGYSPLFVSRKAKIPYFRVRAILFDAHVELTALELLRLGKLLQIDFDKLRTTLRFKDAMRKMK